MEELPGRQRMGGQLGRPGDRGSPASPEPSAPTSLLGLMASTQRYSMQAQDAVDRVIPFRKPALSNETLDRMLTSQYNNSHDTQATESR
jgi:hypothetical protein